MHILREMHGADAAHVPELQRRIGAPSAKEGRGSGSVTSEMPAEN